MKGRRRRATVYRNPVTGRFARRGERFWSRRERRRRLARPEAVFRRRDPRTGQFTRWRIPPRAPAGASRVARRVRVLVRRIGIEEAGGILGRSPHTLRRLIRTYEAGEPLGSIITSKATLARWEKDLRPAIAVRKRVISMKTAMGIIAEDEAKGPEGLGWRLVLQRYIDREEVNQRVSDYLAAGVPPDFLKIVYDEEEEMYRIAKAKVSPGGGK